MILYRLLSPFIGVAYILRSLWAILRGAETFGDLGERFGGPRLREDTIWIHGASVGEMNAARPIIQALANSSAVLVTATTLTGRDTVQRWGLNGVTARLAPLDWRWVTRRLLRDAKIKGLIIIENELWPMRIITAHQAAVPVVMINARMSAKSARVWARFPRLAQAVIEPMRLIGPQDADSATRLQRLGGENVTTPINLKGLYLPNASAIPPALQTLERDKTILAAATHEGEDAIVLDAFAALRSKAPDLKLIIAPRHPKRGADIGKLCQKHGFGTAFRSKGDAPDRDVYIADTLGDMHLWYRLAGVAFIGGSLVSKGGHTPFEPAAYGCPILHGPHVGNFTESYARLTAARAVVTVTDATTLAAAYLAHLGDEAMAMQAKQTLTQPDLAPLLDAIAAALGPHP